MLSLIVACPDPASSPTSSLPASGWVPNPLASFTGLDLQGVQPGDMFAFCGSSNGQGPVALGRHVTTAVVVVNGVLTTSEPGAWDAYAFVGAVRVKGTSLGAYASFQGKGVGTAAPSPTSFTWQVTLAAGTPKDLNPPAWQADHGAAVGDVVAYANGAYGRCTSPGKTGSVEPAPDYYASLDDGGATFLVTGPQGFTNGVTWVNATGGVVYTSGVTSVTSSTGLGPIADGTKTNAPNQPSDVFVLAESGGVIAVQGFV